MVVFQTAYFKIGKTIWKFFCRQFKFGYVVTVNKIDWYCGYKFSVRPSPLNRDPNSIKAVSRNDRDSFNLILCYSIFIILLIIKSMEKS